MIWLALAAAAMALTALAHSWLGEKELIAPLLASRVEVLDKPRARLEVRMAWHLTSVLMLLSAAVVAWPGTDPRLVAIVGGAWLVCGLVDAALTRGRQEGWPLLAGSGILALIGSAG